MRMTQLPALQPGPFLREPDRAVRLRIFADGPDEDDLPDVVDDDLYEPILPDEQG